MQLTGINITARVGGVKCNLVAFTNDLQVSYNWTVNRDDTIGDLLREAGLRRTPVRIAVLEMVRGAKHPLGAPGLIKQLTSTVGEQIDSVTVYRTLNTLVESKLVHRVRGEDGAWRYAGSETEAERHSHAHFVCDSCGTVECLEKVTVPEDLVRRKDLGKKYDVSYAEVVVHGVCPNCH